MMELYRKRPKRFIWTCLILGILLILLALVLYFNLDERTSRIAGTEFKTETGTYDGDLKMGEASGSGTFTWEDGTVYEGSFNVNSIEGDGETDYNDDRYYLGHFSEDKRDGKGTFYWSDDHYYEGSWEDDKMSGYGDIVFEDGSVLSGTFSNGRLQDGTYTCMTNKAHYTFTAEYGDFIKVKIKYNNGDTYEGDMDNGKKEGEGTYTWDNGASYAGEWKNDRMHGEGTFYYSPDDEDKGYSLSGQFIKNRPEGILQYSETEYDVGVDTEWSNGRFIEVVE